MDSNWIHDQSLSGSSSFIFYTVKICIRRNHCVFLSEIHSAPFAYTKQKEDFYGTKS